MLKGHQERHAVCHQRLKYNLTLSAKKTKLRKNERKLKPKRTARALAHDRLGKRRRREVRTDTHSESTGTSNLSLASRTSNDWKAANLKKEKKPGAVCFLMLIIADLRALVTVE